MDVTLRYKDGTKSFAGVFAGIVTWVSERGWELNVFADCPDWDYVDSVRDPSGRIWSWPVTSRKYGHPEWMVINWRPSAEAARLSMGMSRDDIAAAGLI